MSSSTCKGKLSAWKDNKGFGFIKTEKGKQDVFIHITALKKMSRRPVIGDVIFYQKSMDNKGKIRAVNARIEGVKPIPNSHKKLTRNKKSSMSFSQFGFVPLLIIIIVSFFIYNSVFKDKNLNKAQPKYEREEAQPIYEPKEAKSKYKCEGKIHCSQMTSCEEAMFYLNNCPGVKIDGDGDGIPCERQWCQQW